MIDWASLIAQAATVYGLGTQLPLLNGCLFTTRWQGALLFQPK